MDFEQDAVNIQAPTQEKLSALSKLAAQQLVLEEKLKMLEKEKKNLTKMLDFISRVEIPEAMDAIGMKEFTLKSGAKVKVAKFYDGKVDDTNIVEVSKWLKEKGHGALLKKEIVLDFANTETVDFEELQLLIRHWIKDKENIDIGTGFKQGVHHQTLKAFIKEQVESGNEFPLALFKAYVGDKSKVTLT